MNKILLTTTHPAPYMDILFNRIEKEFLLEVFYTFKKSENKTWVNYTGYPGKIVSEISITKLVSCIKRTDLIVVGGWASFHNLIIIFLSFLLNKKCAIFSDFPDISRENSFKRVFKKYIIFPQINYLFCATQSTANYFMKKYKVDISKLKIFPYLIELPLHSVDPENQKQIKYLQNKIEVFVANNFVQRKGYENLIKAMKLLKETNQLENYQFTIAGTGPLFNNYKEKFKKLSANIKLLGWISSSQYIELMNQTDVFIHASIFEPFGIPPLDALAHGKLVIVSDGIHSTNSIITNGVNGFIFSKNNYHELFTILSSLNELDISYFGMRAIEDVRNFYNLNNNVKVLKEIIEN